MSQKCKNSILRGGLSCVTVGLFVWWMLRPALVTETVKVGMNGYVTGLLPVLFPYMVLSHIFSTYGLLEPLSVIFPVHRLFSMDKSVFGAFVLGQVCGYPVGASVTAGLYRKGCITKEQGELLLGLSGGASPAFLIHVVGVGLWNCGRFGVFLYLCQVFFTLLAGTILGRRVLAGKKPTEDTTGKQAAMPFAPCTAEISLARCICDAIGGSAVKLVAVGGYIVFFTLLSAMIPFPGVWRTLAAAILEFASGTVAASSFGGLTGLFLTGFAVGWGGLSVFLQTAHMSAQSGLRLGTYCIVKLASGVFCGSGALVWGLLFPMEAIGGQTVFWTEAGAYGILFPVCWVVICRFWGKMTVGERAGNRKIYTNR